MASVYLTDFDLDGDVCECGQPVATHSPIARPRALTEGRGAGEAHPFSREWRAAPFQPVVANGPGIQITRPRRAS